MVGRVPALIALRDLFYASGLGFLLCCGYCMCRILTGGGRKACFLRDALYPALGALLYRSAAMSRLYAGIPRWYTLAGCVLGFLAGYAVLGSTAEHAEKVIRRRLLHPAEKAVKNMIRPAADILLSKYRKNMQICRAFCTKKRKRQAKKRLQNSSRVLYNSK